MTTPEHHLFVLWSGGRRHAEALEREIRRDFRLLSVCDLGWTRGNAFRNLLRFYNNHPLIILYKGLRCGTGSPRLFLVEDPASSYEERDTTSGRKVVNIRMFDAKTRYRKLTGGGHLVHGTNSPEEFRHDYALLTGETPTGEELAALPDWDGVIRERPGDLAGQGGWSSLADFFRIMRAATPFLVLRNFEALPGEYRLAAHGDVDFLAARRSDFVRSADARPASRFPGRAVYRIRVAGEWIPLDLRSIGDGYYDAAWEEALLRGRVVNERGIPVPDRENWFYSLLYHALVHKYRLGDDYRERLTALAREAGEAPAGGEAPEAFLHRLLDRWLQKKGYRYVEPQDRTVHFNPRYTGRVSRDSVRRLNALRRKLLGKS